MEKSRRKISSASSAVPPSDIPLHFFKVYLPSFSLHNLKIPKAFMKKLNVVLSEKATLKDPLKRVWHVEVKKVKDTFYFRNGWEEFVKCYCLKTGDFMVFRYAGNSSFYVHIFDNTECEKKTRTNIRTPIVKKEVESDDQTSSDSVIWISEGEDSVEEEIYKSKRSAGETEETSDLVGFVASQLPYFVESLKRTNKHYVHIPARLANRDDIGIKQKMVLRDPSQKSWPVTICFMKDRTVIGKGWFDFWRGNNLNLGDRCIFEFKKYNVRGSSKNSDIIDVKFIQATGKRSSGFSKTGR